MSGITDFTVKFLELSSSELRSMLERLIIHGETGVFRAQSTQAGVEAISDFLTRHCENRRETYEEYRRLIDLANRENARGI